MSMDLAKRCERQNIGATYSSLRVHLDIYITEQNKIRYKSKDNIQEFYLPYRF